MPVMACTENGKPGFQYGKSGKCYTYTPRNKVSRGAAKLKAYKQGAIIARKTGEKI